MTALATRRTLRFAAVVALSVTVAYGLGASFAFLAPMFAILMTAAPAPPMPAKALFKLLLVVLVTLGIGLLLMPLLRYSPITAVMLIAVGLYGSNYLSVGLGKGLVGTLLTIGLGMIPAAGLLEPQLARRLVTALPTAIAIAIVCQWVVYPWFPEDPRPAPARPATAVDRAQARWVALRAMLIVLPAVLLAFTNPTMYMATILKSTMLAQQSSQVSARAAGHELLGSTFLAGCMAIVFWLALKLWPSLWMYSLWMLLLAMLVGARLYGVARTRHPPSYWTNAAVTMLILLGPAIEDSLGRDPYDAFLVRFSLFIGVTLYAWFAIQTLDYLRASRGGPSLPVYQDEVR